MNATPTTPLIVVGVDGSPDTARLLTWVTREAALRRTSLLLVHAAGNTLDASTGRSGDDLARAIADASCRARQVLDDAVAFVHALDPGVVVDTQVSLDASGCALGHTAERPSLVVVGIRSETRTQSTLDGLEPRLGHGLECPLIEVGDTGESSELVVLTDGTAWSVPVLAAAFEEASLRGLAVTVAHVLADPFADDPAQDLRLMDETARIEAASGPSDLGFQRTLLGVQVQVMRDRFPAVPVRVVDLEDEVDRLLAATPGASTYLLTDSAHLRRLHELAGPSGGGRWITVIVPSDRPETAPEIPDARPEVQRTPERELDLEAWWDEPTVDEPRVRMPVRVRVRRLRRHLEP